MFKSKHLEISIGICFSKEIISTYFQNYVRNHTTMHLGRNKAIQVECPRLCTPEAIGPSYLKSCGAVKLGGVDCLWKHISDVSDEFFQVLTGLLQVCCIDDNLDKLENNKHM